MGESATAREDELLKLASEIVAAFVSNNTVAPGDLPAMIKSVHATLGGLAGQPAAPDSILPKPAVPIKRSVTDEYIVCLEDGKKLKMLKRYLRTRYKLTPDEYRAKWGLGSDYPMVAPNYAAKRSEFAKQFGLGRPTSPGQSQR